MGRRILSLTVIQMGLLVAATGLRAQSGDAELQVNSFTPSDQRFPDVAATGDGGFVVTWTGYASSGDDSDVNSVQWRRFAANTLPLAADVQVNTYTTDNQQLSRIGVSPTGEILIVWGGSGSTGSDDSGTSTQGRRFAAGGSSVGSDVQINSYTFSHQISPHVAGRQSGDFVVTWDSFASDGSDGDGFSIQVGRVDATTGPAGADMQVNTYTTNWQNDAAIATAADGSFVVAWESGLIALTRGDTIRARRFDAAMTPLGSDFLVNTDTSPEHGDPDVAIGIDGRALVVWEAGDGSDLDIRGRLYTAGGVPDGDDFVINAYTTDLQANPSAAADPGGGFVVVWSSFGSFGGDTANSIQARRLTPDGTPILRDFQVNLTENGIQAYPDVAARSDGTFIVVWESGYSTGTDSSGRSILGRVIHSFPLYADGFESGDTSHWSAAVP